MQNLLKTARNKFLSAASVWETSSGRQTPDECDANYSAKWVMRALLLPGPWRAGVPVVRCGLRCACKILPEHCHTHWCAKHVHTTQG